MEDYDIIIVGAGPAGLTAGIYAGRQGMKTLILEMMMGAGSGYMVPLMENYPGFELISGKDLLDKMRKQAEKYVQIKNFQEVKSIDKRNNNLLIKTSNDEYMASAVIISTGSRHRRLKVPGEADYLGKGVCYCATCDGPLYQGRKIIMVGGGNAAAQEALYLDSLGCQVTLIHRRDELRAEPYLQEKLKEKEIPIIWDSVVEQIQGEQVVNKVIIFNRKTQDRKEIPIEGVFIAIGEEPLNKIAISAGVDLDSEGYIVTDKFQRTNIDRIYAAGDITGGIKQWVVSCSEGAIAALSAQKDLNP